MKLKLTWTSLILLCLISVKGVAQDFPYISLGGHSDVVQSIAFSSDGKAIASGSDDGYIFFWDASTGLGLGQIYNEEEIFGVAFSSDGKTLASAGDGFLVEPLRLWELSTGKLIWQRASDSGATYAVSFSLDGDTLASGGNDDTIDLWEVSSGNRIRTLAGHRGNITDIAFSPDARYIASGSWDSTVRLWDATDGKHLHTLVHGSVVWGIAFSPDSQLLASASADSTIRLWDVSKGRYIRTLTGHTKPVRSVSVSPDGTTLASGSEDGTIRLWELSTGRQLHTLVGHNKPVHTVAFNPKNGQQLASGYADGAILLWELPKTHVRIRPEHSLFPEAGKLITVNIDIVDGEKIRAFELSIGFDPSVLRFVSSTHGDFFPPPADAFYAAPILSSGNDVVTLSGTYIVRGATTSKDSTLLKVTFEVLEAEDSFIDLLNVKLTDIDGRYVHTLAHSAYKQGAIVGDVNKDRSVNVQDLVLVSGCIGKAPSGDCAPADVSGDGVVNILDLIEVAAAYGDKNTTGDHYAPLFAAKQHLDVALTRTQVQSWLSEAQSLNMTDATSLRGIAVLEQLLAALTPKETALFANFPNPFNPETWIPYQLAASAKVSLAIYATDGTRVRTLILGHQSAGLYTGKSRAAYWDGKNSLGEPVASGVYFYTLTAGDFSATRKLLIRK